MSEGNTPSLGRNKKGSYLRKFLWALGLVVLLEIIFAGVVLAHNCEPGNEADCMRTAGYLVALTTGSSAMAGLAAGTVNTIVNGGASGAAGATAPPDKGGPQPDTGTPEGVTPTDETTTTDEAKPSGEPPEGAPAGEPSEEVPVGRPPEEVLTGKPSGEGVDLTALSQQNIADAIRESQTGLSVGGPLIGIPGAISLGAMPGWPTDVTRTVDPTRPSRMPEINRILDMIKQRRQNVEAASQTTADQTGDTQPVKPEDSTGDFDEDTLEDLDNFGAGSDEQKVESAGVGDRGGDAGAGSGEVDSSAGGGEEKPATPDGGEEKPTGSGSEAEGTRPIRYIFDGVVYEQTIGPDGKPDVKIVRGSAWTDGVATLNLDQDVATGEPTAGTFTWRDNRVDASAAYTADDRLNVDITSLDKDKLFDHFTLHGGGGQEFDARLDFSDRNVEGFTEYTADDRLNVDITSLDKDKLFDHFTLHGGGGQEFDARLDFSDRNVSGFTEYTADDRFNLDIESLDENKLLDRFQLHAGGGQEFDARLDFSDRNVEGFMEYTGDDRFNLDLDIKSPDKVLRGLNVRAGGGQDFGAGAELNVGGGFNLNAQYNEGGGLSAQLGHERSPVDVTWSKESGFGAGVNIPTGQGNIRLGTGNISDFVPNQDQFRQDFLGEIEDPRGKFTGVSFSIPIGGR